MISILLKQVRNQSRGKRVTILLLCALALACVDSVFAASSRMARVKISANQKSFVLTASDRAFIPWGFNYDHDENGRLMEDYWQREWAKVEEDFREMKQLGANVVRVHLQLGKFMTSEEQPNRQALRRLARLLRLSERLGLYLDITGLGCYHKKDVPAWYETLSEERRWAVQARFWQAIARQCKDSPAIFCYDLMNEPVVPGGGDQRQDWLGPPFAGKHFVQFVTLDIRGRKRSDVAQQWIHELVRAIRQEDKRCLITVGLVPWSLDRPGLSSGFVPDAIAGELDFISVHLYPDKMKEKEAIETLRGFSVGKPVLIEETFPLKCSVEELSDFIHESRKYACGWIGFYWGRTIGECRESKEIRDALTVGWLEFFQREARKGSNPGQQ